MTFLTPVTVPFPGGFHPYGNIQPFTTASMSMADYLDSLREWLVNDFVKGVNGANNDLNTSVTLQITNLIASIDETLDDQVESVNTLVQSIINSSITVQDPVVAGILNNVNSQAHAATVTVVNTETVNQLNNIGSPLRTKFDSLVKDSLDLKGAVDIRRFYDNANPPTDFTDTFTAALNYATLLGGNKAIYLPAGMRFTGTFNVVDKSLNLTGGGCIVQRKGYASIIARNTPGATIPVLGYGLTTIINQASVGTSAVQNSTYNYVIIADASNVKYGDQYWIESDNAYAGKYVEGSDRRTLKRSWVHVDGLAMNITPTTPSPFAPNPAILQDQVIIGANSGARATVRGMNSKYGGDSTVVFYDMKNSAGVSTSFTVNENLLSVAGTVVGVVNERPKILTTDPISDTVFTNNINLRKIDTSRTINIDGILFDTESDPHDITVLAAQRKDAVQIYGYVNSTIKAKFLGGYSRGVSIECCRVYNVDLTGGNLANNPSSAIGAFGYLCQVIGASWDGVLRLIGINCRHTFTTNAYPQWDDTIAGSQTQAQQIADGLAVGNPTWIFRSGVPTNNLVSNSAGFNNVGPAFDTHPGAVRTRFLNCNVFSGGSGGQDNTRDTAFNNRAWDTTFENCYAFNCTTGFQDSAYKIDTEFETTIKFINCRAVKVREFGFKHGSDLSGGVTANGRVNYEITDCNFEADPQAFGAATPYKQCGIEVLVAATTITRTRTAGFNYCDIHIRANIYGLTVIDPTYDNLKTQASTGTSGYIYVWDGVVANSRAALIEGGRFIDNLTGNSRQFKDNFISATQAKVRKENMRIISPNTTSTIALSTGTVPAYSAFTSI